MLLHKRTLPSPFILAMDRDASVAYYRECMSSINVGLLFDREGFVEDDALVSSFKKYDEAKLGESLHDIF